MDDVYEGYAPYRIPCQDELEIFHQKTFFNEM